MLYRSRAPVRIDFAGGWTDVALFAQDRPGLVINAGTNVYSYVTISSVDFNWETKELKHEDTIQDGTVKIYSSDFDVYVQAESIRKLEYDGSVDLVKAAIKQMAMEGGFTMITQSTAPPGSGLGTSASMGVALLAALAAYGNKYLLKYEIAELASLIERKELSILGGKQDHYASAVGGISYMEFHGEDVKCSTLDLSSDTRFELEKNLILCYTGKSRLSGDIHANVTGAFKRGDKETVGAINELKDITAEMKIALMSGDLRRFGKLLFENWKNQKRLHPSVTNSDIDGLFNLALSKGAIGGKACGAGGGGCILFYCSAESHPRVRKALEEAGIKIIDFNFDEHGALTWKAQ